MIEPEDRWEPGNYVDLIHIDGPDRTYDKEAKDEAPRPVGFTAHLTRTGQRCTNDNETEPLLWEGDNG